MTARPTETASFLARFNEWREKYFPERQLFLRSQGRVRFLTIHSYTQMAMALSLLVAFGWGLVTSYAYLSRDHILENKNKTISTMSAQYQTLSSDFSALEAEVERRASLLEERQQFLEEMLDVDEGAAPATVAPAEADATEDPPAGSPDSTETSLIDTLLGSSPAHAAALSNNERRIQLLTRLQEMENRQRALADMMLNDYRQQIAEVDAAIAPSNLNSDDLLAFAHVGEIAAGGPYVPDHSFEGIFDATDGETFIALKDTSDRLKMVTNALNSYPIGKPAEKYYISSNFGRRRDPIKKTWARHSGLDMAGWPGTAILATAPGTVIYSGWYGPYGNMVEIDHGNGFRTRYGHMRKLRVKKNEEVTLGQRLGDMGRTGRVTDTHLHYEVWFDDKVRDPMPFLKAAEHVLKIQGRYEKNAE